MAKHIGLDGKEESSLELIFSFDGKKFEGVVPVSNPPVGSYIICNMFVTPEGKLVIEYSDQPVS